MTSPVVGSVSVEILAEGKALAKSLRQEIESAFKGLNLGKQIRDSVGTVRVPVEVDVDNQTVSDRLRGQKIPVQLDPDTATFEARLRALLARTKTQKIKVDVDQKSLNSLTSSLKGLTPSLGGVSTAVGGLARGFTQLLSAGLPVGSQLGASLSAAVGPVGAIVSALTAAAVAMGALSAAAILAGPALLAAAGAAAAIPAALSGLGAVVGTLGLGFKGISEAFKPKSGGGGGGAAGQAAQQARQIASASRAVEAAKRGIVSANRGLEASERSLAAAQRGVAQAQQSLVDAEQRVVQAQQRATSAQEAVNRARREAKEDIEDLNRSLRGAQLGEKEAAQAVEDALRDLNSVKLTGKIPDIVRAQNAYDRAVLSLEEAQDATGDLQEQSDESAKAGVEGSDKVQNALKDQADAYAAVVDAQKGVLDAQNGILDAADSLASAQDGVASALDGVKSAADGLKSAQEGLAAAQEKTASGAGGVAKEVIKLAPAAQKFVDAIKSLKPAFEALRLDVQERLFRNLDQTVLQVGRAWIPALRTTLGSYADTFNQFFRDLGTSITTPKFISDIQAGAEGARQGIARIGDSITTSLVPAFGALSKAAGPFLEKLGEEIAGIVEQFSNWVLRAEQSGALQNFFTRAGEALHDIFTTGKRVTQIIGDIFQILTGSEGQQGSAIDSFNRGLEKVHEFLSDPKNQAQLRGFVDDLKEGLTKFGEAAKTVNDFLKKLEGDNEGESAGKTIGRAIVSGIAAGIKEAFLFNLENIVPYFGPFGPLVIGVKKILGIKSPSTVFAEIGHNIVEGLIGGIGDKLGALADTAGRIKNAVVDKLKDAGSWLVNNGRSAVNGLAEAIRERFPALASTAGSVKSTVVGAITNAGTWLYSHGQAATNSLANGIKSLAGNVGITAGNLRVPVYNALAKDANSLLYSPGQAIALGLARGIDSMGARIGASVANLANQVADRLNAALQVHSPSRVTWRTGLAVGEGLALGIEDRSAQVEAAASQLAALAVPQVDDATLGISAQTDALSRNLSVADSKSLLLGWKRDATGNKLLDAIASMIDLEFNGDVTAALSRT
ncbi:hypothetical protein [Paractinoplanes toevensis]|uniref:Phage-related protein n=1 Tax=Paractinoplanes toevensis TaxID=571911 RepID=A0A919T3M8_9ACTN|nr:hypothetical protein [Actinoplanes toevensis]GIM88749.1 hypothetical protein Ato02nite_005420 [Actinoplanes toevensis]